MPGGRDDGRQLIGLSNLVREERDREEFYHLLLSTGPTFCRKSPAIGGKMLVYQERSYISQVLPSYVLSLALFKHPGCGSDLPNLR